MLHPYLSLAHHKVVPERSKPAELGKLAAAIVILGTRSEDLKDNGWFVTASRRAPMNSGDPPRNERIGIGEAMPVPVVALRDAASAA